MTSPPAAGSTLGRRRPASWKLRVAALVLGCGLALIIGEVGLRLCGYPHVGCYQPDQNMGARLVPNYGGWQHKEGHVYFRTNAHGWRDREHSLQPGRDTFRIAVLGDSFSEAVQVELEETYWAVLERELAACPAFARQTVEVMNFGVSGYGTTQEYFCLEHEVWQFQPDLILLQFLPGNDVRNNSKNLEPELTRPFYLLDGDTITLDDAFRNTPSMALAHDAHARNRTEHYLQWKHYFVRSFAITNLIYELRHPAAALSSGLEPGIEDTVLFPPIAPEWMDAWQVTDRVLAKMQATCEDHDVPLVVFTANNAIQVHPEPVVIHDFARSLNSDDVLYPDEHLRQLAKEVGFRFISLTLPMREIAQREHRYFHGFENTAPGTGHWNIDGHRTAGKLLAEMLCDRAGE